MWRRGSTTLEASLLMGIMIPLLIGIIYLGFFLHDKALLQGAAIETAVYASLYKSGEEKKSLCEERANMLIRGRLLGIKAPRVSVNVDTSQITVKYEGKFKVPSMILKFFYNGSIPVKVQKVHSLKEPARTIQKVRGIQQLLDKAGE